MTDSLAMRLIDEAAGTELSTAEGSSEFLARAPEVIQLMEDLNNLVGHLLEALQRQHGSTATDAIVEVPALLKAARDREGQATEEDPPA